MIDDVYVSYLKAAEEKVKVVVKQSAKARVRQGWRIGRVPTIKPGQRVGRNDPCPCGSGNKVKRCCGK